jgi:hypothetical protein
MNLRDFILMLIGAIITSLWWSGVIFNGAFFVPSIFVTCILFAVMVFSSFGPFD